MDIKPSSALQAIVIFSTVIMTLWLVVERTSLVYPQTLEYGETVSGLDNTESVAGDSFNFLDVLTDPVKAGAVIVNVFVSAVDVVLLAIGKVFDSVGILFSVMNIVGNFIGIPGPLLAGIIGLITIAIFFGLINLKTGTGKS